MKGEKSDSSEFKSRINECYLLLLQGFRRKQIIQYGAKWSVSDRQIDDYIKLAREIFDEDNDLNFEQKKNEALAKYYDLYQKNYELEDYKECRNVLKDIKDIFGIDAEKNLNLKNNGGEFKQSTELTVKIIRPIEED
jgi:hypothetical protein